eukprot:1963000-Rhodomonas_salina.3
MWSKQLAQASPGWSNARPNQMQNPTFLAISGTELPYGATSLRACKAVSSSERAHGTKMSGTDLANGGTRLLPGDLPVQAEYMLPVSYTHLRAHETEADL